VIDKKGEHAYLKVYWYTPFYPFLLTLAFKYDLRDVVCQIFGVNGVPQIFFNAKCTANQERLRTTALEYD